MRNFTNDTAFDDTLPVADGLLEAGFRVPIPALADALQAWFGRKGWLAPDCTIAVSLGERQGRIQPAKSL